MPNNDVQHLELFRSLLQLHTGFNFPAGLEKEFNFRIERALSKQGWNLGHIIHQLSQARTNQAALQEITPLLTELLIGETYFGREPDTFAALTSYVIPEFIKRKEPFSRLLRVWSAACSTGEELYSLSIKLRQFLKDTDWVVSLMGSDINETALEVARRAEYGSYSFRGEYNLNDCFEPTAKPLTWRVKKSYQSDTRFQMINLATNSYPSISNDTCNYDLIFCRNIFIYFKSELIEQVVERLFAALNEGGYLVVSPCEYSMVYFKKFETIQVNGVTFYRRPLSYGMTSRNILPEFTSATTTTKLEPYRQWSHTRPATVLDLQSFVNVAKPVEVKSAPQDIAVQLFQLAKTESINNQTGKALDLCLQVRNKDPLLAENYLCLTNLYQLQGQLEEAYEMARKFIYLEPNRVEGQFYAATLQHKLGREQRAAQACRRVLNLLENVPPHTRFEYLANLTAADIKQTSQEILALLERSLTKNLSQ